jgi:hypothetical protein
MEKVLRISNIKSTETDFIFWSSKSVQERLAAVEALRKQYINFKYHVDARLQRVCRVIDKKRS